MKPPASHSAAFLAGGLACFAVWGLALPAEADADAAWLQWGGPGGDFHAPAGTLASSWPESGPPTLWSRPLGPGYSAILFENERLYTAYRDGEDEVVVCLAAGDGATVWERRWNNPHDVDLPQFGTGPRATPTIAGERLFAVGVTGRLVALNKTDGTVLWEHELWGEAFGGTRLGHGYSSSPVAWGDEVIVNVGGEKAGVVAFDQKDGSERWRSAPFRNSFGSPRILSLLGKQQVVTFAAQELLGLDPASGALLWRFEFGNQWGHNIAPPLALGDDLLVFSSPHTGARGVRLTRNGETFAVEELWSARRIQLYHVSAFARDGWVYAVSGTATPAFVMAFDMRSGEIAWRERGFAKANVIEADGKLVLLDEDGTLAIARATPEKFEVLAQTQLLDDVAWTVPTLVGRTLYVRDPKRILAVDLGPAGS